MTANIQSGHLYQDDFRFRYIEKMNTIYILILLVIAVIVLVIWLVPRLFDQSSERLTKNIPELESFPQEERGRIWLDAIFKTLFQWQVISVFLLVMGISGGLIIRLNDLIPNRWEKPIVFLILFLLFIIARPFIIRRAREVLVSRQNSDNNEN